ncbi:MAG TPA: hypothetical protein VGN08_02625 [Solirubrobacteraceae bacterium]|jgi:hypothetical protein
MAAVTFEIADHFLSERGQRAGFVLLGAFLASFLFIRTSARLMRSPKVPWWPGSVSTKGGLHIHHLVFGIVLILLAGFLEFALAPTNAWLEVLAALFGIGAGLTLDEFALWLHLDDVYWAEQGRASVDAVLVATLLGGLIVLGLAPFEAAHDGTAVISIVVAVVVVLLFCAAAILKGKPLLGLIGVFLPPASIVGAIRLAEPTSPWARRRYTAGGRKLSRSKARFERVHDRRRRARDAIGGAPSR